MNRLLRKLLDGIRRRIRKQRFRETVNVSDDLYIDTSNISDGEVRLYAVSGGELAWERRIGVESLLAVLKDLMSTFSCEEETRDVHFGNTSSLSDGTFHIRKIDRTVVLDVYFGKNYMRADATFTVDRDVVRNAIGRIHHLKQLQGGANPSAPTM